MGLFPQRSPIIVGSFAERDLADASNRIWMYKCCGVCERFIGLFPQRSPMIIGCLRKETWKRNWMNVYCGEAGIDV